MDKLIQGEISTLKIRKTEPRSETIFGTIRSEDECMKIIDMSRLGALPMIKSRLSDAERNSIRPGSIYVYEEGESGISRWTDGKIWSTSKISGRCLLYYELIETSYDSRLESLSSTQCLENILKLGKEIISLSKDEKRIPKKHGLIKMTTSLVYQKKTYHMLAYFTESFAKHHTRSSIWDRVAAWEIPRNLVLRMNYRRKRKHIDLQPAESIRPIKLRARNENRSNSLPAYSTVSNDDVIEVSSEFLESCYLKRNDFFSF
ncbi:Gti1/Pac2 family transcription factor [Nematocida ausubeli]|uniref:Gti1/Pac2 family protein n=1 Tax=Nematocida ausubeli (strain ATCC PRA-371 / ERTm2) TaxID=1913371 RepID=A0A086J4I6_NEMA1|nr:uncharacterized protein NESG_00127 [Nematocida ausubeli]KAI5132756.1 Gti1/Pac2 family transcription factor [Nematocida ausubeli]KAI5148819.1 Gti1/Pac2 family transcription factor [Nematocida ausubeli]KAI5163028.1 Gti1/Pac2 family transcription factor [Nematocida ausubeli]KFG27054.1 hypothetical protein NESG_00127 [Nematocida ausubeli]